MVDKVGVGGEQPVRPWAALFILRATPAQASGVIVPAKCKPRSHGESPIRHHLFLFASSWEGPQMSQPDRELVYGSFGASPSEQGSACLKSVSMLITASMHGLPA